MKSEETELKVGVNGLTERSNTALEVAIRSDLGVDLKIEEMVQDGYQANVYRASQKEKTVFVLIGKDEQRFRQRFQVEILGYKMLKDIGIPTPNVVEYEENPPTIRYSIMILSAANGVNIEEAGLSPEQKYPIYEQVGEILRRIHEIRLDGFGPLEIKNGKLQGRFSTYKEYGTYLREKKLKEVADFLIESKLVTTEELQKLQRVFDELTNLDFKNASLLHKDMHSGHIFVDKGKITGIIDLGSLGAGDPRYDIANSFVFQNENQREHFKNGYGKLANDPLVFKYLIMRTAQKIEFRSKKGKKESAAKLAESLREMLAEVG